jgi:hypothetical protein
MPGNDSTREQPAAMSRRPNNRQMWPVRGELGSVDDASFRGAHTAIPAAARAWQVRDEQQKIPHLLSSQRLDPVLPNTAETDRPRLVVSVRSRVEHCDEDARNRRAQRPTL